MRHSFTSKVSRPYGTLYTALTVIEFASFNLNSKQLVITVIKIFIEIYQEWQIELTDIDRTRV